LPLERSIRVQSALPSGWKVIEAVIEVSSFSFVLVNYIEANFRFKFGRGTSSEPRLASSVECILFSLSSCSSIRQNV
jgi:hypothetical protein